MLLLCVLRRDKGKADFVPLIFRWESPGELSSAGAQREFRSVTAGGSFRGLLNTTAGVVVSTLVLS